MPSDLEIEVVSVAYDELNSVDSVSQSVIQVEFSVQNANYLNVLLRRKDDELLSHHFKVYKLNQAGMSSELAFNLDELVTG